MSRHLTEYNVVPAGAVIRINMAWEPSLLHLIQHLTEITHHVFLDIPTGRKKPPSHSYSLEELLPIVERFEQIRYVAISNVEWPEDLESWTFHTTPRVNIVPKIETIVGVENIDDIFKVLREPKTIMIDHDDLFTDLIAQEEDPRVLYSAYIDPIVYLCKKNNVRALRTAGIVFSD